MRYLILSDIHANLEAMQRVLEDADDFDAVLFLGDAVGYGPNPNECTELLQAQPRLTALAGNHDLVALGQLQLSAFSSLAAEAARWTAAQLTPANRAFLRSLNPLLDTGTALLAHASPRDPVWEYLESEHQAASSFRLFGSPVCLVGHTHVPRIFVLDESGYVRMRQPGAGQPLRLDPGRRYILNPGSVGQPRDGDPRAAYAQWDSERGYFEFRRVAYSVISTQEKILGAGLPSLLAARLAHGR